MDSTSLAEYLNQLEGPVLAEQLRRCCAAEAWVEDMSRRIPFCSDADVEAAAASIWNALDRSAWLEAFAAHPRIGDVDSLRAKFANTRRWADSEQAGVGDADQHTLKRLAELNHAYFDKFGFLFIICATGKSADEMRQALEQRLAHDAETELRIAADEQLKITLLRLRKLST
jgi:OHCU decarboxylase